MNRTGFIGALATLAAIAAACTGVQVDRTSASLVRFIPQADWSAASQAASVQRPDTFDVAASRTLRSLHGYWDGVCVAGSEADTLSVEPGEWETVFFSSSPRNFYRIDHAQDFMENPDVSMRAITAHLPLQSRQVFQEQFATFEPVLVSYYDTLYPAAPLYLCAQRPTFNLAASEESVQMLTIQPKELHQSASFRIRIVPEDDTVLPTRVVGCITGIPASVELMSGYIGIADLGQTALEFTQVDAQTWEGQVDLLGILAPKNEEMVVGPGILRVLLEFGRNGRRRLRALNLKPYLDATPLIIYTHVEGFYEAAGHHVLFDIQDPIYLTASNTEDSGEEPISSWKDPEDSDVRDILDGYDDDELL